MLLQDMSLTLSVSVLATVALPLGLLLVLLACLQCFRKKPGGFSNLSNSTNSVSASQAHVNTTFTLDVDDTNIDAPNSTSVTIEPLPNVASKPKLPTAPLRPRMGCLEKSRQDASLKLIAVHHPFPRNQIVYLKELGTGWFGKVIESDAEKITTGVARNKVVVKMLKDDASKDEQLLFFEEVAPFRELEHSNVIRLLGQCTEMHPMLMIMESAAFGNLKQYLRNHRHQQAALVHKKRLIQFAVDAACGLACLHRHDYLHRDLAARNCLVMGDHTLKIGDYGIAEDLFKEDYFTSGNDLLPVRWMAPETLKQENGTWSSHNFSKESDIWSLGVVLWEIAMMGERPYDMLTDEAVLQGVIVEKVIRLPEPDIGMPDKDRLYEVMRFCWLDQSQRIKVDEVHSLLQQLSSKAPEEGAPVPKDSISAFEQKWEHLMPNQRHMSVDSIDDQLGSVSSGDSDLLVEELSQPDSLEDLTAQAPLQAPPRSSRKKVSAAAFSVSQSNTSESVSATMSNKADEEPVMAPAQISISFAEEAGQNAMQVPQVQTQVGMKEAGKAVEPSPASALETEFTEFTSHDASQKTAEGTLSVSQVVPDVFESSGASLGLPQGNELNAPVDAAEDPFQIGKTQTGSGDAVSKVQGGLPDHDLVVSTPGRPKSKPRKTSTPIAKDDASPSSSASFSPGSSSSTFLTALSSSPGNLTDAYTTASDSTLVVNQQTKASVKESSDFAVSEGHAPAIGDGNLSFEIFDTTAVPSGFKDFDKPVDESQNAQMPEPIPSLSQNPFVDASPSVHKDDSFGEFTYASEVEGGSGAVPPDRPAPTAHFALPGGPNASTTQDDFVSFVGESSMTVSQTQSSEASSGIETSPTESKPVVQDADPFPSFWTELSSLESFTAPAAGSDANQEEQAFPRFATEFSSLDTSLAATPQAPPQSDPFALDPTIKPSGSEGVTAPSTESLQSSSGLNILGDFSFDMLSSLPDVASNAVTAGTGESAAAAETASTGNQQVPDLFGDLNPSSPPAENSAAGDLSIGLSPDASPDSGNQSGTQQSLTDLFGFSETVSQNSPSGSQDDSIEVLDSKESGGVQDLLSGFSAAPPASSALDQSSSPNPFSGDGALLQEFAGAALATMPASALKDSQDDVLVANGSGGPDKSPNATLLDSSVFESTTTTATTASTEEGMTAENKSPSNANGASSLIDF